MVEGPLRRQIRRATITSAVGIVSAAVVLAYIVWGPELSEEDSVMAVFLLLASASLAVFGFLAAVLPWASALSHYRLARIRSSSRETQE